MIRREKDVNVEFFFFCFFLYFFKLFEEVKFMVSSSKREGGEREKRRTVYAPLLDRNIETVCVCTCSHGQYTSKRVEEKPFVFVADRRNLGIELHRLSHPLRHAHRPRRLRAPAAYRSSTMEQSRRGTPRRYGLKASTRNRPVGSNGQRRTDGWLNSIRRFESSPRPSPAQRENVLFVGKYKTKATAAAELHTLLRYGEPLQSSTSPLVTDTSGSQLSRP